MIDVSDSMNQNDPEYERLSAARNLIDDLPQGSDVSIVSFGVPSIIQTWTDDKELLKSVLTKGCFESIDSQESYNDMESAWALLDDLSPVFNKVLVIFTDGERENINDDLSTISDAKGRGTRVFTVGFGSCDNRMMHDYFKPLSEYSGGGFYPIADDMSAMHRQILGDGNIEADSDGDGIPDYYEDKITLFNGTKIQLDKHNPDTDGDGLLDGEELELDIQLIALDDAGARVRVIGKMYSNPAAVDTDFDGLSDLVDASPLDYDSMITFKTDDCITFNSGRNWWIIKRSAYDIMDNLRRYQGYDSHVDNPISPDEFNRICLDISYNNAQEFSDEELVYIGLINNEGAKLYMHYNLSAGERENVFRLLTDRECKYYQHTGFLWWTEWKEIPYGTQGGFFTGSVITEADLNYSMEPFCRTGIDYIDLFNAVVILGACLIASYITAEIAVAALYEATAFGWYIGTFGIRTGLDGYYLNGSQYYYNQIAAPLENGVLSVIEADAADGKLDGIDVLFSSGNAVSDISDSRFHHIYNRHVVSAYVEQVGRRSNESFQRILANTSFYNPEWTNEQVRAAATYAYNQALANGVLNGEYSVQYLGEEIAVALQNGLFKTAYGPHYFTLEEFYELLGVK